MGLALTSTWAHPPNSCHGDRSAAADPGSITATAAPASSQHSTYPMPILRPKPRPASQRVEQIVGWRGFGLDDTLEDTVWTRDSVHGHISEFEEDTDGLVFDFEEVPPCDSRCVQPQTEESSSVTLERNQLLLFGHQVEALSLPTTPFQLQLLRDVQRVKSYAARNSGGVTVLPMALELARLGYNVVHRQALGGSGPGINYLTNLRHEFAYVAPSDSGSDSSDKLSADSLLIEFNLRQHFAIAAPTLRFEKVLQMVPDEFVGTKARLVELIALVSLEIEQAFKARGLSLPPWRQARSLLSKWFPRLAKDEVPSTVLAHRGGTSVPSGQASALPWLHSPESPVKPKSAMERTLSCPVEAPMV